MKRFFIAAMLLLAFTFANAQVQTYRTTSYAYKTYSYTYRTWSDWSDWIKCEVIVTLNLNTDVITIYSNKTQIYKVYAYTDPYYDDGGGVQIKFSVIDQDGDRGTVRLRIQNDGNSQLYVDFADIMWVYNVYRLN